MSLDATRWAWKLEIRPAAKLLVLSLADRAGENHSCYPSLARLTKDTGLDRKTIIGTLQHLENAGIIRIQRRQGFGNVYHLLGVEDRHTDTSTKNGTGTRPENGTGQNHTRPKNGTGVVPKTGRVPVPKTGHESTNESINESLRGPVNRTEAEMAEGKKRLAAILSNLTGTTRATP